MRYSQRRSAMLLALVPLIAACTSEPEIPRSADRGLDANLKLSAFEFVGDKNAWTSEGDIIRCSGKPRGYCYTKQSYGNFLLRLDYQFPAPADAAQASDSNPNTGVLLYITGKPKVWPISLEVQGKFAEMGTIKENGGAKPVEISDHEDVRQSVRKPVGEWNSLEILSEQGALTATLNGSIVCQSQPGELKEGSIGLQSEGFEVLFRNIHIEPR